ncbi:MAG: hypothetical protein NXY57DRAFT_302622 [Lentinula lateritia]|nr:MAG: hypothetical protein NXY57DRAFT_302622 [Lentinula lateritia]
MTPAQSQANRSLPGSRAHSVDSTSFHTPAAATSTANSKRSSMLGPARNEPPPVPPVIPEVVAATPSLRASSVRSSRPSLSRTPTENGSRVDFSRDQSRGRSTYKGKERTIPSPPPTDDGMGTASTVTSNRNSSSRLADTLSSVWGAVSPTARSIAESLKSKEATPLSSPIKRELREILHSPPAPLPEPAPSAPVEGAPMSAVDMPGAFETGVPAAVAELAQTEPSPAATEYLNEAAAWGSFTSAGEAAGANMGPTNLRISTALSNRAPSAVISPINLPEMNMDLATQPMIDAGSTEGMLSLSNEAFLASDESSDFLSGPPESAPSNTNNLADLLGTVSSEVKSPTKAASPVSASSKSPWSTKASPKPASSPNPPNLTTPAAEVPPTSSKSPWGTPKPAGTPRAASKLGSKIPSKVATPLTATTPKPAATPKAATPVPASSPKPEASELPPPTSEPVEPVAVESQEPTVENAVPDATTQQTTETPAENSVPSAPELPSEPAATAALADIPPTETPEPAEVPAEPAVEATAEITQPSNTVTEETAAPETTVAATPDESAPGTAPGTPGDGLNGADIEGEAEEGDDKDAKEEEATTPGGKKKKNEKKKKKKGK